MKPEEIEARKTAEEALSLVMREDYDGGIAKAKKALDINENFEVAYKAMGLANFFQGNQEEAIIQNGEGRGPERQVRQRSLQPGLLLCKGR